MSAARPIITYLLSLAILLVPLPVTAQAPVMLANVYRPGIVLSDYWVSEKYDGVRAYWDGQHLYTRGGELIAVPAWFIAGWPTQALDGELWAGHGKFATAVSTVRTTQPNDQSWRAMRFMVFDLPLHEGTFDQRLPALQALVPSIGLHWVVAVSQQRVGSHAALQANMEKVVAAGGEGVMLHRGSSLYRAERNDDLLKFKPFEDSEAIVIGYTAGKGKYRDMVGALLVQTPEGLRFKLGSGLSDIQRRHPPAIGSRVTYRYRGINATGIPRFAVFMRVRED